MTARDVRLPLLLLVEVAWGWAFAALLAQIFSGGDAAGPSAVSTGAIVLGSFGVTWALRQIEVDERQMRIAGALATAVALAAVVPLEFRSTLGDVGPARGALFGTSVAFVALWIRGIVRGRVQDDLEGAVRSVGLGIVPVAIAAGTSPPVHGPEAFGALAIGYVVVGLLVLALYRIGEPERPVAAVAAQWGVVAAVVVVAAVALTAVAAAIDPGAFGPVGRIGEPLRGPALFVAEWVLGPPLRGLAWLLDLLIPDRGRTLPPPQLESQQEPERERDENEPAWALPVRWLIGGAITTLVVFGALLMIALLFRRFRRPPDEAESRADIEREGTLADDLGDLLGALGRRFRRGPRPAPSAIAIRRLYARMLDDAAAEGLARPPHATPAGFAPHLEARYRSGVPVRISEMFAASRYGAHEIDDALVTRLAQEWEETVRRLER